MVADAFGALASALSGGIGTLVLVGLIALVPEVRRFDLSAAIAALTEPAPETPRPGR